MSTYPVDIKGTQLTATGTIFAGPARILGLSYVGSGGAGTIELLDNATSLVTIDTGTGDEYIQFPGTGFRCLTSAKATLTTVDKVTFYYG
tara:strand:- start:287 stop:556 length:270 start_codon:yes stop_codon:yes gene_type:complete